MCVGVFIYIIDKARLKYLLFVVRLTVVSIQPRCTQEFLLAGNINADYSGLVDRLNIVTVERISRDVRSYFKYRKRLKQLKLIWVTNWFSE